VIVVFVLAVALVTRTAAISQVTRTAVLGVSLGVAALYVIFGLIRRGVLPKILVKFVVFSALLVAVYSISVIYSPNKVAALYTTAQLSLVLLWVLFVSFVRWTLPVIRIVYALIALFVLINFTLWWSEGFIVQFKGFLNHKNSFGAIIFSSLFFIIYAQASDRRQFVRILFPPLFVMSSLLVWASGSRTSLISALVSLFVYAMWPAITRNRFLYILTFAALITGLVAVIFVYIGLANYGFYDSLQEITREHTYGPFHTGREIAWPILIDHISQKPLLGWGAGFHEESILEGIGIIAEASTAENLYLAVAMQTGMLGIILLAGLLISIWSIFYIFRADPVVRLSAAFFFGICVHQCFELSLIQNNISVAVLFWTIIGIGINRVIIATSMSAPNPLSARPKGEA